MRNVEPWDGLSQWYTVLGEMGVDVLASSANGRNRVDMLLRNSKLRRTAQTSTIDGFVTYILKIMEQREVDGNKLDEFTEYTDKCPHRTLGAQRVVSQEQCHPLQH